MKFSTFLLTGAALLLLAAYYRRYEEDIINDIDTAWNKFKDYRGIETDTESIDLSTYMDKCITKEDFDKTMNNIMTGMEKINENIAFHDHDINDSSVINSDEISADYS